MKLVIIPEVDFDLSQFGGEPDGRQKLFEAFDLFGFYETQRHSCTTTASLQPNPCITPTKQLYHSH